MTLLDLGADLSNADNNSTTVMHFAARSTNPYLIRFLQSRDVNPSPCDKNLITPMHQAASFGQPAAIKPCSNFGPTYQLSTFFIGRQCTTPPAWAIHRLSKLWPTLVLKCYLVTRKIRPHSTKPSRKDIKAVNILRRLGDDKYAVNAQGKTPK